MEQNASAVERKRPVRCQTQGLAEHIYYYRLRKLRQAACTASEQAQPVQLAGVPLAPKPGESHAKLRLTTKTGTLDAIDAICESFNWAIDTCTIDPLVLAPIFINDFLCIHPFNDGNGRMSRLLTTLLLYRCGYVVGRYISLESKIEKTKEKYYEVLNTCGNSWHEGNNDPTPFVKYLLDIILSAYRVFESRVDLFDEKLPAIELVRKTVNNKIGKFTKSEILEMNPTIGKASVENALKKLIEDGTIQRHGKGKSTFYTRNN